MHHENSSLGIRLGLSDNTFQSDTVAHIKGASPREKWQARSYWFGFMKHSLTDTGPWKQQQPGIMRAREKERVWKTSFIILRQCAQRLTGQCCATQTHKLTAIQFTALLHLTLIGPTAAESSGALGFIVVLRVKSLPSVRGRQHTPFRRMNAAYLGEEFK